LDSSQATGDAQSRDAAVQQLLDRLPSPCGIFSPSDHSAAWLRGRLLNWGWSIPNQFGLIGVGDLASACLSRTPELSSVVIPWQELGYQAVLRLRRLLAGTDIAAPPIITPHFVEARTSTTLVPDTSRLAAKAPCACSNATYGMIGRLMKSPRAWIAPAPPCADTFIKRPAAACISGANNNASSLPRASYVAAI
jgi:hypothetical protein